MNQQRLQAYIKLIQNLLTCPRGEEWILLRQHETLVTPELVQVMEQVATQLATQGNLEEAKFLHNLAGQIHHLFIAQTVQPEQDEENAQAYLELTKALLDCPNGLEGELLAANQELIGPGLVHTMQQVAAQMAANGNQETAYYLQHWATELNHLWLQQHNFEPILKKGPQPKQNGNSAIAPPPEAAPQPQPDGIATATPNSPPTPDDEDFWAEPSKQAASPVTEQPLPAVESPSVQSPPVASTLHEQPLYEQINHHLETIATALTQISEALAHPNPAPADPLWYMDALERACAGNWVLTSTEVEKLIGVQPSCPRGSDSFQRGCWMFVKAGKLGTQMGWHVHKQEPLKQD